MSMIYNGKKYATTGLKKSHIQKRELGCHLSYQPSEKIALTSKGHKPPRKSEKDNSKVGEGP